LTVTVAISPGPILFGCMMIVGDTPVLA
jgi:hypothetical protein